MIQARPGPSRATCCNHHVELPASIYQTPQCWAKMASNSPRLAHVYALHSHMDLKSQKDQLMLPCSHIPSGISDFTKIRRVARRGKERVHVCVREREIILGTQGDTQTEYSDVCIGSCPQTTIVVLKFVTRASRRQPMARHT